MADTSPGLPADWETEDEDEDDSDDIDNDPDDEYQPEVQPSTSFDLEPPRKRARRDVPEPKGAIPKTGIKTKGNTQVHDVQLEQMRELAEQWSNTLKRILLTPNVSGMNTNQLYQADMVCSLVFRRNQSLIPVMIPLNPLRMLRISW